MKYVHQFCVILLVSLAGEGLHSLLPLPVPAGIYGLLLMLALLLTGALKLEQVEQTGLFLVDIMPLMFIASAAGLLDTWAQLWEFLPAFLVTVLISTWAVMGVSGRVTQRLLDRKDHGGEC